MTLQTALLQGTKLLEDGRIPVPRLTAEVLLCHAVQCERPYLYAHPEQHLREVEWLHYGRYLHQRLEGKPTQYITHKQEFYGREFRVTPDVLIPRPETEHVIEAVLTLKLPLELPHPRIVDVGCGSGAIAVTLALENPSVAFGTDISMAALSVAAANARRLGAPVHLLAGDVLTPISDASMDVVVSNPPYIAFHEKPNLQREVRDWEPELALFAGPAGFEIYERLVSDASRVLRPWGWLVVELGFDSHERVSEMVKSGWHNHRTVNDLAGIPRVLACQKAD